MKKLAFASLALLGLGALPAHAVTAYASTEAVGNQGFTGVLGLNFTVNSAIDVTQLGVFDSEQNGFVGTLWVGIFNSSGVLQGSAVSFDSSSAGTLSGYERFKAVTPFTLAAGDYQVAAVGFSTDDPNINVDQPPGPTASTLDTGGGLISFVNNPNYSFSTSLSMATGPDGGPVNRYTAGTFQFTAAVPEPETYALMLAGLASMGFLVRRRRGH